MKTASGITVQGNVCLYSLPADWSYDDFKSLSREEKEDFIVYKGENLVVDSGLQHVLGLMVGSNTVSFTYIGVGSGTNNPTSGDLALQTEIDRNPINDRYRVGLTAHFDVFFGKNDANGTWNETAIFNASSSGIMLARRKFPSAFTKNTSKAAVIAWSIIFSSVAD